MIFRCNGETLKIEPWGKDSFRVRSVMVGDISDYSAALLEPEISEHKVEVSIQEADEGRNAKIVNGNITAECFVQPWGDLLRISFK